MRLKAVAWSGAFALGIGGVLFVFGPLEADAASRAGRVEVVGLAGDSPLASGGSATAFRFKLPARAACKGDSAGAGYRVQSYAVPSSVDPGTLAFDASGPAPVEGEFRAPFYDATPNQDQYVNAATAVAARAGQPGPISQPLPAFSFAAFDVSLGFSFTPGVYNVGIACTLGPPLPTQQEKYWNTVMTVAADPADPGPAKLRWSVDPGTARATESSAVAAVAAVAGAGAVAAAAVLVLGRRPRRSTQVPDPPKRHPVKESR